MINITILTQWQLGIKGFSPPRTARSESRSSSPARKSRLSNGKSKHVTWSYKLDVLAIQMQKKSSNCQCHNIPFSANISIHDVFEKNNFSKNWLHKFHSAEWPLWHPSCQSWTQTYTSATIGLWVHQFLVNRRTHHFFSLEVVVQMHVPKQESQFGQDWYITISDGHVDMWEVATAISEKTNQGHACNPFSAACPAWETRKEQIEDRNISLDTFFFWPFRNFSWKIRVFFRKEPSSTHQRQAFLPVPLGLLGLGPPHVPLPSMAGYKSPWPGGHHSWEESCQRRKHLVLCWKLDGFKNPRILILMVLTGFNLNMQKKEVSEQCIWNLTTPTTNYELK